MNSASKEPDWHHNNEVHNQIVQGIDDILYQIEQKQHHMKFFKPQNLINQVRSIGIHNYA